LAAVLDAVRRRAGLVFPSTRLGDVERGVRIAWQASGERDPEAFVVQLERDAAAFDALVDHLTVGETYFFRQPEQFDLIRRRILPELLADRPAGRPISVWSAGCASGEEPYSLAIHLEEEGLAARSTVLGTDLSPIALHAARRATYRPWSLRDSTPAFVGRYFEPAGEQKRLVDRIRGRVRFERHNLNTDHGMRPTQGVDLILCRNVMIYFEPDAVARVARLLFDALSEDGWLVTAPADPLLTEVAPFSAVVTPAGIVYRRRATGNVAFASERSFRHRRAPVKAAAPRRPVPKRRAFGPALPGPAAEPVSAPDVRIKHPPSQQSVAAPSAEAAGEAAAWAARIRALANSGAALRAAGEADAAVLAHPLDIELHYLRALLAIGQGRDREALQCLRRILYIDRSQPVAYFTLGTVARRMGDATEAGRAWRNVIAICAALPADAVVPLADGESAARLAEAARTELRRLAKGGDIT
jgi:chemotaxis protein methyltransferase CheR